MSAERSRSGTGSSRISRPTGKTVVGHQFGHRVCHALEAGDESDDHTDRGGAVNGETAADDEH